MTIEQKLKTDAKVEAKNNLLTMVKDGDTVYCILRHVSHSGMQRRISLITFRPNEPNEPYRNPVYPRRLDFNVARLLNRRIGNDNEGIVVNGCGMDMGFALVDALKQAMGFKELKHQWL